MINILSVDVEECFHATEAQTVARESTWGDLPSRVESATCMVLDLLGSSHAKATFFLLGWVAERFPALVRRIAREGHEIGCHSYSHRLVYELTPAEFRTDTLRANAAITDACGVRPRFYRAPSYSITSRSLWALDILAECGFTHDSSIYPVKHDRYGIPGASRHASVIETASGPIVEVPIASVDLGTGNIAPVGGGGYLRLLPYRYTAAGIRRINHLEHQPACIYFHPWEIDQAQPRLPLPLVSRLRTYTGVRGMESKLGRLLRDFRFSALGDVLPASRFQVVDSNATGPVAD